MKLKRITLLSNYKNIQLGGTLEFSSLNYTSLVGANGSGKSNWIEVVASVVLHLLDNRTPDFRYRFFLDDNKEVIWDGGSLAFRDNGNEVERTTFELPEKLIACYSGEDHRLWEKFFWNSYSHYFSSETMSTFNEPLAIYVNRYQWAIALITLMCSQKQEVEDFVKELWGEEVPLSDIQVDITIDSSATGYVAPETQKFLDQIKHEDTLYMSHIASFDLGEEYAQNDAFCKRLYYLLYVLSMPVPNESRGVRMRKAIKEISIITRSGLSLEGLSEGHKKRILIMLMTHIIGNADTIYLFDEPDAHVDVAAKNKILGLVENAPGHVVLTTHSPLMTRNMKPDAVMTVKEGNVNPEEWGKIIDHLSDHQFAFVDNFLISMKRKVVITEGKSDVFYIREAVKKLKAAHPELEKLENVAMYSIGGTGDTDYFLHNSLEPVLSYLDKVVVVFDKDDAGKLGYDTTERFFRVKGVTGKVSVLKYASNYPDPEPYNDFYVEDYFPSASYEGGENIIRFDIHGQPNYYEIKKMSQQSGAIKSYLEQHYKDIEEINYGPFLPLLQKLINELGL